MDTANVGVRRGLAVLEISQCATEDHPCCLSSLPVGKAVDSGFDLCGETLNLAKYVFNPCTRAPIFILRE